jgi:hypothetical protein
MPISKKRKKKNGKKVGKGRAWTPEEIQEVNRPAGVTLQDLINVVAAQEYKEDPEGYKEAHPVSDDKQEETEDGR